MPDKPHIVQFIGGPYDGTVTIKDMNQLKTDAEAVAAMATWLERGKRFLAVSQYGIDQLRQCKSQKEALALGLKQHYYNITGKSESPTEDKTVCTYDPAG